MSYSVGSDKEWQRNCIVIRTMKNTTFENIFDAYQLVNGAKLKPKNTTKYLNWANMMATSAATRCMLLKMALGSKTSA
jgi:hypothetical protein